ncbi:AGAP012238-PA [Anopheles gambiae str. PEST]|uniref:AGAP012238-PA n=1 Tax=Anopheles gambiae TaxID=7165 RepID=A0NGH6_ANOGA|nr:AGAP012238-PA [Anopheles gambiae str. PEST]
MTGSSVLRVLFQPRDCKFALVLRFPPSSPPPLPHTDKQLVRLGIYGSQHINGEEHKCTFKLKKREPWA